MGNNYLEQSKDQAKLYYKTRWAPRQLHFQLRANLHEQWEQPLTRSHTLLLHTLHCTNHAVCTETWAEKFGTHGTTRATGFPFRMLRTWTRRGTAQPTRKRRRSDGIVSLHTLPLPEAPSLPVRVRNEGNMHTCSVVLKP